MSTELDAANSRVVVGRLELVQKELRRSLQLAAPPDETSAAALMLALAHHIQRSIDEGEIRDQSAVARRFGISRARITQILDLALLAPSIQEAVLHAKTIEAEETVTERTLRDVNRYALWTLQEAVWTAPRKKESRNLRLSTT